MKNGAKISRVNLSVSYVSTKIKQQSEYTPYYISLIEHKGASMRGAKVYPEHIQQCTSMHTNKSSRIKNRIYV